MIRSHTTTHASSLKKCVYKKEQRQTVLFYISENVKVSILFKILNSKTMLLKFFCLTLFVNVMRFLVYKTAEVLL